ncbi:MAG: hypothetical protein ACYCQJ_06935 [Nitrososphaerales archaeon]
MATLQIGQRQRIMANVYRTEARLLEQLALNKVLSVSQLARKSGLSYPTTLDKVSSFPFLACEKIAKEKRIKIKDEAVNAVYPFLIELQTNMAKKAKLTLALLSRNGCSDVLLGGELALELQLPVKDADPDPSVEIRVKDRRSFIEFVKKTLTASIESGFLSNSRIVEDQNIRASKEIGLLRVSRPEKLLVDAIAEKRPIVVVENIAESIANSPHGIDAVLLNSYAKRRGVSDQVSRVLEQAKGYGFP